MVELPSKPQLGSSARVGGVSNCFTRVLPRSSGTGCFPSSQMYSSLYFGIKLRVLPDECVEYLGAVGERGKPPTWRAGPDQVELRLSMTGRGPRNGFAWIQR